MAGAREGCQTRAAAPQPCVCMARSHRLTGEHAQACWLAGEAHNGCWLRDKQVTRCGTTGGHVAARPGQLPIARKRPRCRLFLCARCYRQTLVCSRCDRGQIYCGHECALEARRRNQRAARARQRRVTGHGSISPGLTDQPAAAAPRGTAAGVPFADITSSLRTSCHRCGNRASALCRDQSKSA